MNGIFTQQHYNGFWWGTWTISSVNWKKGLYLQNVIWTKLMSTISNERVPKGLWGSCSLVSLITLPPPPKKKKNNSETVNKNHWNNLQCNYNTSNETIVINKTTILNRDKTWVYTQVSCNAFIKCHSKHVLNSNVMKYIKPFGPEMEMDQRKKSSNKTM